MEAGQRYVLRHQETAPDRRRYVDQAYPQLEDVIDLVPAFQAWTSCRRPPSNYRFLHASDPSD